MVIFDKSIGWILLLLIWQAVVSFGIVDRAYLSSPVQVAAAIYQFFASGEIWGNLISSLQRSLTGFLLAIVIGIALGVTLGWFRRLEAIVDPVLQFFRQMSSFALFPVFILFLGIGELSKDAIIFWSAFWPILLNTINGVENVEKLLINSAISMGASQFYIFRKVVVPASIPRILTGIRLGGAYSITALVAAEMIGAPSGLGIFVLTAQQTFHIPSMYGGIVILALLGLAINFIITIIEKRLTGWKKGLSH
ncbi:MULTISPECIES: ABC transporter permease [unclassified Sporolactobacillus]|uniref:ABC transporter permease n=1 Tax=unclassified Sporolactobacillus TaxID=2628533 RepID=UPI0023688196|nr:ABC transporter permease [Sporolactobacillus sp. CQH2019]MDD9147420.1 ABC transporter permease [Sporolactobacillus sp. CQH2019]